MSSLRIIVWLVLLATPFQAVGADTPIDQAFHRMYNFDFDGAHAILDAQERANPSSAMTPAVRSAAILFSELHRMKILATEFFADDDRLTDKRLKADPAARARLFKATAEARRLATARLSTHPEDAEAMFAMCLATGIETDYTIIVEKRYFRSFALSRESQMYARKLLALDPPVYDAYLTLGMAEYVVGSMNFFFRLFVRFDKIKGSKEQAIADLQAVIAKGRYYPPFAKILLSVIHLRAKRPQLALPLLLELQRDYPGNALIRDEVRRVGGLVEQASRKTSTGGR